MKTILLAVCVAALSACTTVPDRPVPEQKFAERIEYVVRIPPENLLVLPKPPAPIDLKTATEATVAKWILDNEDYLNKLRSQIVGIGKFLKDTQVELEKEAQAKNAQALDSATAPKD